MKILGIETSCDETAIAVVACPERKRRKVQSGNFKILSNVVSSQVNIHRKWGGVVPNLARREHQKNLLPVLKSALEDVKLLHKIQNYSEQIPLEFNGAGPEQIHSGFNEAGNSKLKIVNKILERETELYRRMIAFLKRYQAPKIDLIAIVNGPGLEPALWVGVNFAKALAYFWQKPVVPVNHLEAHLLTNFIGENFQFPISNFQKSVFPALCLLVSGGHTMLVLMIGIGQYKIIGETRDDSAGECFDKTARILGLNYPGGPAIAKAANAASPRYKMQIKMPRPMINTKDYDFSFSGLKTAVLYHYRSQPPAVQKEKNYITAMAAEIQQAIVDVLVEKTIRAAKEHKVKTIMIGGGVAANSELREHLKVRLEKELPEIKYVAPEATLCTDNGVMAAIAGYFNWNKKGKMNWQKIKADANMKI